jgi:predicted RNA-binding Zn ribbon-like protein
VEEPLPDATVAARQLDGLVDDVIGTGDLAGLRRVHWFAQQFAGWAVGRAAPPDPTEINALARRSRGFPQVQHEADDTWRWQMTWVPAAPAVTLARMLVAEIADLDLGRLKECARPECALVFYDGSRSRTQRWHAENPCGWRARQARHRTP